MNWFWIGGLGLFGIAGVSIFIAFQRGEVIWGFFKSVAKDIYNALKPALLKRNSPAIEEKMQQATRQAQEWDNFNKRPRDKR